MPENANNPEQRAAFLEDVAEFAAGRLSEERGAALLAAARRDPVIMQAVRQEKALESLLDLYEFPELPEGLEKRFWQRFHGEQVEIESLGGRGRLWLKIVGPVAAAVIVALGVIYFTPPSETPPPVDSAHVDVIEPDELSVDEPYIPMVAAELDVTERPEELKGETLKQLKLMDDMRLVALDELQEAEDARLMDDLDTLNQLEPHKD